MRLPCVRVRPRRLATERWLLDVTESRAGGCRSGQFRSDEEGRGSGSTGRRRAFEWPQRLDERFGDAPGNGQDEGNEADRGGNEVRLCGLHTLGLRDQQRAVAVVIGTLEVMLRVRTLYLMAVRGQPGVKHTEQSDQPRGRQ